jgi:hypothetical protein
MAGDDRRMQDKTHLQDIRDARVAHCNYSLPVLGRMLGESKGDPGILEGDPKRRQVGILTYCQHLRGWKDMPILHIDKEPSMIFKDMGVRNEETVLIHEKPATERNAMGRIIDRDDQGSRGFCLAIYFTLSRGDGTCAERYEEEECSSQQMDHTLDGVFYHIS